jgi:hypothetical protein
MKAVSEFFLQNVNTKRRILKLLKKMKTGMLKVQYSCVEQMKKRNVIFYRLQEANESGLVSRFYI